MTYITHRMFETGATRDLSDTKPDYEGFLSPLVVEEFGRYMHGKRSMPDGSVRASDNWQKGIQQTEYIKSAFRHFVEWWRLHRAGEAHTYQHPRPALKEALTALMFNIMGYLHEELKADEQWQGRQAQKTGEVRWFKSDAELERAVAMLDDPTPVLDRVVTVQGHDDLHNHHE